MRLLSLEPMKDEIHLIGDNEEIELNSILIVDDCEFNLKAIQCQLEQLDLKGDFVNDGEQAC